MRRALSAIIALLMMLALSGTALAGAQDFILANRTGYDIYTMGAVSRGTR